MRAAALLLLLPLGASAAAPEGFARWGSEHFALYSESVYPPLGILTDLEALRAKLLLDLASFSPWASEARIEVVLYKDASSYMAKTGSPAWAGGHADLGARRIHVFEGGPSLRRTLAHELAHLFFDDFFVSGSTASAGAPLWLTEGVATRMEWDYGLGDGAPPPRPPKSSLPVKEFLAMDYRRENREPKMVSGWYAQAYAVARILMTRFTMLEFFAFCSQLRKGTPLEAALERGYGQHIPDVAALQSLFDQDRAGAR